MLFSFLIFLLLMLSTFYNTYVCLIHVHTYIRQINTHMSANWICFWVFILKFATNIVVSLNTFESITVNDCFLFHWLHISNSCNYFFIAEFLMLFSVGVYLSSMPSSLGRGQLTCFLCFEDRKLRKQLIIVEITRDLDSADLDFHLRSTLC